MGGGASGRRGPGEVGREGGGEDDSKVWGGRIDATSDTETEEDKGGHALLTAFQWGMQEIRKRGQQGDARDEGSGGRKGTSTTADEGETRGRHEARREQGGKIEGRQG